MRFSARAGSAKASCWGHDHYPHERRCLAGASSVVIDATIAMLRAHADAGHPDAAY